MSERPYSIDQMISAKSIAARIEALCHEIHDEFNGTNKLIVVGLLRGSFVFIADLVRELDLPVEVDFIEVSSYGDGMESSREVRILKDLRGKIEGRDVLVAARRDLHLVDRCRLHAGDPENERLVSIDHPAVPTPRGHSQSADRPHRSHRHGRCQLPTRPAAENGGSRFDSCRLQ